MVGCRREGGAGLRVRPSSRFERLREGQVGDSQNQQPHAEQSCDHSQTEQEGSIGPLLESKKLAGLGCASHNEVSRVAQCPPRDHLTVRTYVRYERGMAELPTAYEIENKLRSIAMLTTGQWALRREDALRLLAQLKEAVEELRRWRA